MKFIVYPTFDDVPKRFLCQHCFSFVQKPIQCGSMYCQAIYCTNCNIQMNKNNIPCNKCKHKIQEHQIDVIQDYLMQKMNIVCTNCKKEIKAQKYQKHQQRCQQQMVFQELEQFQILIQKQIDHIQAICNRCGKTLDSQRIFGDEYFPFQQCEKIINYCQCILKISEDAINSFLQIQIQCSTCQSDIDFYGLPHHFYTCKLQQIYCSVDGCQWKDQRSKYKSHLTACIKKRKQMFEITKKNIKFIFNTQEFKLNSIDKLIDKIGKFKRKLTNFRFVNDSQETPSRISSPSPHRRVYDPRLDWGSWSYFQEEWLF